MKPLILASNPPPFGGEATDAPRWDVAELVRALSADVSYPPPKSGGIGGVAGALEDKTASDMRQAWAAFRCRNETSVFVSLSEKAGLPLSLLSHGRGAGKRGGIPHILIAHHLTSPKKRFLQTRTGYLRHFDRIIVLCRTQARYLTEEAGVSTDRVHFVYDKVDSQFWTPDAKVLPQWADCRRRPRKTRLPNPCGSRAPFDRPKSGYCCLVAVGAAEKRGGRNRRKWGECASRTFSFVAGAVHGCELRDLVPPRFGSGCAAASGHGLCRRGQRRFGSLWRWASRLL